MYLKIEYFIKSIGCLTLSLAGVFLLAGCASTPHGNASSRDKTGISETEILLPPILENLGARIHRSSTWSCGTSSCSREDHSSEITVRLMIEEPRESGVEGTELTYLILMDRLGGLLELPEDGKTIARKTGPGILEVKLPSPLEGEVFLYAVSVDRHMKYSPLSQPVSVDI